MNLRTKNFLKGTGYLILSTGCGILSALVANETIDYADADMSETQIHYTGNRGLMVPIFIGTTLALAATSIASAGATVWHYTKAAVGEEKASAIAARASQCCSSLFSRRPVAESPAPLAEVVTPGSEIETPFLSVQS